MTVISSQRFINYEIVEKKKEVLTEEKATKIICPVCKAYCQDLDGNDLYILTDGHHTLKAARELGLEVEFEEVECPFTESTDFNEIMEEMFMDSSWYYIDHEDEDNIGCDVW